jgi:hypothetical protein
MIASFTARAAAVATAALGFAALTLAQHDQHQHQHQQQQQKPQQGHEHHIAQLPQPPANMPAWMTSPRQGKVFYRRGPYNFAVFRLEPLARDLNGITVGHSLAYEDLVTGKADQLETVTFDNIVRVLKSPPRLRPGEHIISPTFSRLYPYLEQVFEWTHILHDQTIDLLASDQPQAFKEREMEALWRFYSEQPYAITGLPMNMAYLDSQPWSKAFRQKYPKVNGLFWGYHWLQGAMYDMLWLTDLESGRRQYEVIGDRYHRVELWRTDRPFMPMFADVSPEFSRAFPHIANAFDNLHMLHDMVNDILATDWLTDRQKEEQIKWAVWSVLATTHASESPMDFNRDNLLHDHRHYPGMPGMGMMELPGQEPGQEPTHQHGGQHGVQHQHGGQQGEQHQHGGHPMNFSDCAHCGFALPPDLRHGVGAKVLKNGTTLSVRCLYCARHEAEGAQDRVIIRAATEDPDRLLILVGDGKGGFWSNIPGVVFLEEPGDHKACPGWSRAFTSVRAFREYVGRNPQYASQRALSLAEFAARKHDHDHQHNDHHGGGR